MAKIALSKITSSGIDATRLLSYVKEKGLTNGWLGTMLAGAAKNGGDNHNVAYQLISEKAPYSLAKALASGNPDFEVNFSTITLDTLRAFYDTYVIGGAPLPPKPGTDATPASATPSTPVAPANGGAPNVTSTAGTVLPTVDNAVGPEILSAVAKVWSDIRTDAVPAPATPRDLIALLYNAAPVEVLTAETPRIIVGAMASASGNRPPLLEKVILDLNAEVQAALLASLQRNASDAVANTVDDVTRRVYRLAYLQTAFNGWDNAVTNAANETLEDINAVPDDAMMADARKKVALASLKKLNTDLTVEVSRAKAAAEAAAEAARVASAGDPAPLAKIEWAVASEFVAKEFAPIWNALDAHAQKIAFDAAVTASGTGDEADDTTNEEAAEEEIYNAENA